MNWTAKSYKKTLIKFKCGAMNGKKDFNVKKYKVIGMGKGAKRPICNYKMESGLISRIYRCYSSE